MGYDITPMRLLCVSYAPPIRLQHDFSGRVGKS